MLRIYSFKQVSEGLFSMTALIHTQSFANKSLQSYNKCSTENETLLL